MALCVALELKGRRVLIAGGGKLALKKALAFEREGALITLVAPDFLPEIAARGEWTLTKRAYAPGDARGFFLVLAATGDEAVNALVAADAARENVLCGSVQRTPGVTFHAMANAEGENFLLAASTKGSSPFLAQALLKEMEDLAASRYERPLALLREIRALWLAAFPGEEGNRALFGALSRSEEETLSAFLAALKAAKKEEYPDIRARYGF